MPEIIQYKGGGQVVWNHKDWMAGLSPKGQNTVIGGGNYYLRSIDPFSILGVLAPGRLPADVSNVSVVTGALQAITIHNGKAYSISADGKIVEMSDLTTGALTTPVKRTISAHGGHSGVIGYDILTYYIGSTKYAFYSWSDNTDGDVGRYDLNTTFYDDWLSNGDGVNKPANFAKLDTKYPHPLEVGHDDVLYIGDGNNLHGLDGQIGTYGTLSKNVLTLPKGFIIKALVKTEPNLLAIFAYKTTTSDAYEKSEAKMYLWDYLSLDPYKIVDIDDYYVGSASSWNGNPICFTKGKRNPITSSYQTKLKIYDGVKFQTLCTFNEEPPINGGIQTDENFISWNAGGTLYVYGSPLSEIDKTLNAIAFGEGTTSGLLSSVTGGLQVMSSGTTTSGGLQKMNTSNYRSGSIYTNPYHIPSPTGMVALPTAFTVEFYSYSSSTSLTVDLYAYFIGNDSYSRVLNTYRNTKASTALLPSDIIKKLFVDSSGNPFPPTSNIYIGAVFSSGADTTSAPIIKTVTMDYEYITI